MAAKKPRTRTTRAYDPTSERAVRFCLELLKDFNASRAAREAGYSATRSRQTAHALLAMPEIQARITGLIAAQQERVELNADALLTEFVRIGLCDIAGAFDEFGGLKPLHEIPVDVRRAISGIETEELFAGKGAERTQIGVIRKVKFWNKLDALMALAKRLKFFPNEKVEHDVHLSWEQVLANVPEQPMPRAALPAKTT